MAAPRDIHMLGLVEQHRQDREPDFPGIRDSDALNEVAIELTRRGDRLRGTLYTYPRTTRQLEEMRARILRNQLELEEIEPGFLGPGKLLVVPRRLPLSDYIYDNRKRIRAALDRLDAKLFDIGWQHFRILSRTNATLTPHFAEQLSEELANRASIDFKQNQGAFYRVCTRLDGGGIQRFSAKDGRTWGYVLYIERVASLEASDLLAFGGMGGVETLALAHHLRTKLAWLLDEPGFTIVEFTRAERPRRPRSAGFAAGWQPQIVLRAEPRLPNPLSEEAAVVRALGLRLPGSTIEPKLR
jgi:hypothetical protein